MKILVDTNILISAFVFKGKALKKLENLKICNELFLCDYSITEFKEVVFKKFINNKQNFIFLINVLKYLIFNSKFKIVTSLPKNKYQFECRDKNDNRIIDAAIENKLEAIFSADKDILEMTELPFKIIPYIY
jgi:putative PIN family toxin of toxin-antitoxin system